MAFVIAVSGISGAGKSSVIQRAAALLGGAPTLSFDDYRESSTYPRDLREWAERGAPVDEFQTPGFARDLRTLRSSDAQYALVEEPFGRMRSEMRDLIDFAAHLDVPADVLLVRRLLRRLGEERHLFGDSLVDQLHRDLHDYLAHGRFVGNLGALAVKQAADFVLDGTRSVEEIAAELVEEVRRHS